MPSIRSDFLNINGSFFPFQTDKLQLPYFIDYSVHTSSAHNFILQFYFNTLFMNKVGECDLPSIVRRQYFSIIFNEKSGHYMQ